MKVVKNSIIVYEWKGNLCTKNSEIPNLQKSMFYYYGIPLVCPRLNRSIYCTSNEKITTLGKGTKRLFPMFASNAGVTVKVDIVHDTGKSCFESFIEVVKRV